MKLSFFMLLTCLILTQTSHSQNETYNTEDPNLALHKTDGAGVAAIGCGDPSQRCDSHLVRLRLEDQSRADRNTPRSSSSSSQGTQEGTR